MATLTSFHVKQTGINTIVEKLKQLSGISESQIAKFPSGFRTGVNLFEPDCLVIGNLNTDWTTIHFNSADTLEDWSEEISAEFKTCVIVTLAQSVSDYYYFAYYDKGEKLEKLKYVIVMIQRGLILG